MVYRLLGSTIFYVSIKSLKVVGSRNLISTAQTSRRWPFLAAGAKHGLRFRALSLSPSPSLPLSLLGASVTLDPGLPDLLWWSQLITSSWMDGGGEGGWKEGGWKEGGWKEGGREDGRKEGGWREVVKFNSIHFIYL